MSDQNGSAVPGLVWFTSILVAVSLTKNPFYLMIIVMSAGAVYVSLKSRRPSGPWGVFLKIGLSFFVISLIYNILISHHGATVMFVLPAWLPIVGGPVTAEAAVFGAVFGLTFLGGILAFAVINMSVGISELLRFLPGFLRNAATVISIAFNFIPATVTAAAEIRQAQAIRGLDYGPGLTGRVRRAGAAVVPLIVTGLEKAVVMAESMESRAYGGAKASKRERIKNKWNWRELSETVLTAAPMIVLLYCIFTGGGHLGYAPYPKLTWPSFDLTVGASLALLAAPAVLKR